MANEAVNIELPKLIVRRTIGGAIGKNVVCKLTDPNTVAASDGANVFGGITLEEVTAAEYTAGVTEVSVGLDGVWDLVDAGAGITVGGIVSLNGANLIKQATEAEMVTGAAFGKAEETAGVGERIRTRLFGY